MPSVVKIPRAENTKVKSKVGMARGPVLYRQKRNYRVLRPELKRCIMTESIGNKYNISRKSPVVPVKCSPKMVRKERALELNTPWDSMVMGSKI